MQYTVRGIPATLDAALRRRARSAGQTLNAVVIEVLAEGAGLPARRANGEILET
jgi:hypothetical protein